MELLSSPFTGSGIAQKWNINVDKYGDGTVQGYRHNNFFNIEMIGNLMEDLTGLGWNFLMIIFSDYILDEMGDIREDNNQIINNIRAITKFQTREMTRDMAKSLTGDNMI